jgi:DNA-binding NarL/FixJ family response regulator
MWRSPGSCRPRAYRSKVFKAEFPAVRVVGLAMYEENQIVHAMRQAGATAVISKTGSAADLLKTIYDTTHRKDPCRRFGRQNRERCQIRG